MRVVLQRVKRAAVTVDANVTGQIGKGILLLLGVHKNDTRDAADFLAKKCAELRIFQDELGKMSLSAIDIHGEALVVSQFTLYGDTRKGRRPDFTEAAPAAQANELYEYFVEALKQHLVTVRTGIFGAMMEVELVNDGPVTLILDK
jgi:D-aminoacyl-tRNA deacylase